MGVNYYRNYGPPKLLHFLEYLLDQLNNKHMKVAVNSTTQYFESRSQKIMSAKSLKSFGPPSTKWQPRKNFAKLNGIQYFQTSRISDIWFKENA